MTAQTQSQRNASYRQRQREKIAQIRYDSEFLIDRLTDYENAMTSEEDAREWHGRVTPAIARLRSTLGL